MFALALLWTVFKSFDFSVIFNALPSVIDTPPTIYFFAYEISSISLIAFGLFIASVAKLHKYFYIHGCQMQWKVLLQFLLFTFSNDGYCRSLLDNPIIFHFYLYTKSFAGYGLSRNINRTNFWINGTNLYDVKRIIAFSTCSQLGFMVFACGLGYFNYAFLHLVTHAFFKCLLFLCSGAIIHALGDEQDMRKIGNCFILCL